MATTIDYQAIKRAVSMERAIELLGIVISSQDNPQQLRAQCPRCRGSNKRALSMNLEKALFTCFANKPNARGDVIALTAHVKSMGQKEAAEWLSEQVPAASGKAIPVQREPNSKVESSRGKSRPVLQLIRTDQLEPTNDDRPAPEPPPTDDDGWTYADLI